MSTASPPTPTSPSSPASPSPPTSPSPLRQLRHAADEDPIFAIGERVRVARRAPIGHYRVPVPIRGKYGIVERVIKPVAVDNEEEGYGRNAGARRHYYRIAIAMTELWPDYTGRPADTFLIEIFETWLERA